MGLGVGGDPNGEHPIFTGGYPDGGQVRGEELAEPLTKKRYLLIQGRISVHGTFSTVMIWDASSLPRWATT